MTNDQLINDELMNQSKVGKLGITISFVIISFVILALCPAWAAGQAGLDLAVLKAGVGSQEGRNG